MQDSQTPLGLRVSRQVVITFILRSCTFCQDQKRDDARHPGGNDWHPVQAFLCIRIGALIGSVLCLGATSSERPYLYIYICIYVCKLFIAHPPNPILINYYCKAPILEPLRRRTADRSDEPKRSLSEVQPGGLWVFCGLGWFRAWWFHCIWVWLLVRDLGSFELSGLRADLLFRLGLLGGGWRNGFRHGIQVPPPSLSKEPLYS